MPALNDPQPDITTTTDPFHGAVIDDVCASDAARVAAGEPSFVRQSVDHELCRPGGSCYVLPDLMVVVAIAPGIRTRRPLDVPASSLS